MTINQLYFQHDGAPAHNARRSVEFLNTKFGNKWLGTRGPVLWPARSPDFTPLDYFFWGYIKDKIYLNPCRTIIELKQKFEAVVRQVPNIFIFNALTGLRQRCEACIEKHGNQFEHFR